MVVLVVAVTLTLLLMALPCVFVSVCTCYGLTHTTALLGCRVYFGKIARQPAGAFAALMFCLLLNADLLLVPDFHMMDMNIISLVTISLLMVSAFKLRGGGDEWRRAPQNIPSSFIFFHTPTHGVLAPRCIARNKLLLFLLPS